MPAFLKRLLLTLLSISLFGGALMAQQAWNITGIVTDEKDQPIPGATVFLGDSRKATATDANGNFTLQKVQVGKYSLVVRMIGYVIATYDFTMQNKDARFRIKLLEDNQQLKTVNISGIPRDRREYYLSLFIRCFFGTSDMARECKVLNPEIIQYTYDYDTSVLTAKTDDFLIIENWALGYRIKYLLTGFSYQMASEGGIIAFAGKLFYEDLPGDGKQQQKWKETRADVYFGSITHFFRALFNNALDENKFVVYRVPDERLLKALKKRKKEIAQRYTKPVGSLNNFITDVDSTFKRFDLNPMIKDSTQLYVLYTPKREPRDFYRGTQIGRTFKMPLGQLSLLRPMGDSVLLINTGEVSPAANLLKGGFWSWGQMAAFIPPDYELPPDLETPKLIRLKKKDELILK